MERLGRDIFFLSAGADFVFFKNIFYLFFQFFSVFFHFFIFFSFSALKRALFYFLLTCSSLKSIEIPIFQIKISVVSSKLKKKTKHFSIKKNNNFGLDRDFIFQRFPITYAD